MTEALDVFKRCSQGVTVSNFVALATAYKEAIDQSWPEEHMQIDVLGLYVLGQGVVQASRTNCIELHMFMYCVLSL